MGILVGCSSSGSDSAAQSEPTLSAADARSAANAELSDYTSVTATVYSDSISDSNMSMATSVNKDQKIMSASIASMDFWVSDTDVYYQKDGTWYKYAPSDASSLYTEDALSLDSYLIPDDATQGDDEMFNNTVCYVFSSSIGETFYVSKTGHLAGVSADLSGSTIIVTLSFDEVTMPDDVASAQEGSESDYMNSLGSMYGTDTTSTTTDTTSTTAV